MLNDLSTYHSIERFASKWQTHYVTYHIQRMILFVAELKRRAHIVQSHIISGVFLD
jgi:hypothetical protein